MGHTVQYVLFCSMIDYRCISCGNLLRLYYGDNVSLCSATNFRPSTFLTWRTVRRLLRVGSLDNLLRTWKASKRRDIRTQSCPLCYGAADRHCGSSSTMRRSWSSSFMSPHTCDRSASVYGKYIVRDLSSIILESAMTWLMLCRMVAISPWICHRSALSTWFSHGLSPCDNGTRYGPIESGISMVVLSAPFHSLRCQFLACSPNKVG